MDIVCLRNSPGPTLNLFYFKFIKTNDQAPSECPFPCEVGYGEKFGFCPGGALGETGTHMTVNKGAAERHLGGKVR